MSAGNEERDTNKNIYFIDENNNQLTPATKTETKTATRKKNDFTHLTAFNLIQLVSFVRNYSVYRVGFPSEYKTKMRED